MHRSLSFFVYMYRKTIIIQDFFLNIRYQFKEFLQFCAKNNKIQKFK